MNARNVLTAGLVLFVLASVATLVLKETGVIRTPSTTGAGELNSGSGTRLVAYYLHGKVRCVTCNDIEKTAREALESGFAEELQSGRVA